MAKRPRAAPPGEPRPSIFDNRTRLVAIGMVLFAVVLAVWGRPKSAPLPAKAAASEDSESEKKPTDPLGPLGAGLNVASGRPADTAAPAGPPPVIDEIVLEKKEVCAGEENLVTVKAHTIWVTSSDETRRKAAVEYVLKGLESGALRPVIDRSFKLDEMREVHRYLENNGQFGKIVVTV